MGLLIRWSSLVVVGRRGALLSVAAFVVVVVVVVVLGTLSLEHHSRTGGPPSRDLEDHQ